MSIQLTCIECGTDHSVNENMAGRRIRCPQCDTVVHVPASEVVQNQATDGNEDVDSSQRSDTLEPVVAEPLIKVAPRQHASLQHPASHDPKETHVLVLDGDDDDDEVLVRTKRPEEEMDMTPMVDVTFLLLIFFMVTAAFSLQKSIQMPRQQTDAPSTNIEEEIDELDVVEIQVDEFGSFLVMAPGFERETPGKLNLITALREAIAGTRDGMRLDIKVHESAKLHALVDAMDAGTIAGYSDLHVMQVEDFD